MTMRLTILSSQVPLAMASKTMRHSTLSTTTEIYGHLLRQVGHDAVKAIETALTLVDMREPAMSPVEVGDRVCGDERLRSTRLWALDNLVVPGRTRT
jgi:hypothetical protein